MTMQMMMSSELGNYQILQDGRPAYTELILKVMIMLSQLGQVIIIYSFISPTNLGKTVE